MRHRSLLPQRPRRATREPVVPMINVVFLLLIFFLMTAQIVPPAPFDITLPSATGEDDTRDAALYIDANGDIAFGEARGDAALALAVSRAGTSPLRVQVDADLSATTLARLLTRLSTLGAREVEIVTEGL